MRWLVTIVVLATACGSKERQCGPEAYELEEYLKRVDKGLNWLDVEDVKLVERPELEKRFAQQSLVLRVRRGMPVDADTMQQLRYSVSQFGQRVKTDQVALLIEGDVTWEDVVGATNAAMNAGIEKVVFVFAAKPAVEPPPRTKIDDDLDKAGKEIGARAQRMAEIGKVLIEPCIPLAKAFGKVAFSDADRETQLIKAVTPALLECDCKIDMPALRSWLYRVVASKPLAVIDVIVSPASPNRIELPPETPWREAHKKLTKDMRSVVLAVPAPEPPPEELTDAGVDAR
jgi:hypothetical protein